MQPSKAGCRLTSHCVRGSSPSNESLILTSCSVQWRCIARKGLTHFQYSCSFPTPHNCPLIISSRVAVQPSSGYRTTLLSPRLWHTWISFEWSPIYTLYLLMCRHGIGFVIIRQEMENVTEGGERGGECGEGGGE